MDITVKAFRWDGSLKYSWPGELMLAEEDLIVVKGSFTKEHKTPYHHFLPGDKTMEYYPLDAWYNVCEIYGKEDTVQGIYCNLAAPPEREGPVLTFVDLVLDLYVFADGEKVLLNEKEFETFKKEQLPKDIAKEALDSWEEMLTLLSSRETFFSSLK